MRLDVHWLSDCPLRAVRVDRLAAEAAQRWSAFDGPLFSHPAQWPPGASSRSFAAATEIGEVFVKHHRRSPWRAACDAITGTSSRAIRGFLVGTALAEAGIDAVRPLLAAESRLGVESLLVLEHIEARNLLEVLRTSGGSMVPVARELGADFWNRLGEAIAAFHERGFRQRDLKATNILIVRGGSAQGPTESSSDGAEPARIVFADLEGMKQFGGPPPEHDRARDLARLAVSLSTETARAAGVKPGDWEEVLRSYLSASSGSVSKDLGWWIETTAHWAEHKEKRNRARGRPLT